MKKLVLSLFSMLFMLSAMAQLKYVDSMYPASGIAVTKNIKYAYGISVLTGVPKMDSMYLDLYEPTGNTGSPRPLIIFAHTGNFLPRYKNQQPTGARDDSATVAICKKFAQRGYVVASMSYRLGWNPISTDENVRRGTIINAAYRGVQDMAACVRFFKKHVKESGNTWNIDSTKIAIGGQGTGGYISLQYSALNKQSEIRIDKFYNFTTGKWMVQDSALMGDLKGFKIPGTSPALLIENYKGYTSNAHVTFNMGGALGDSSWLEAGEIPIISAHGVADPFAPYKNGIVAVPGTVPPLTVVDVSGSYDIIKKTTMLGNNAIYKNKVYDHYTIAANKVNDGYDGLFPIVGLANGNAPWEWWADTSYLRAYLTASGFFTYAEITAVNQNGYKSNPLVSKKRAIRYIDSLLGYFSPRIAISLGLYPSVGTNPVELANAITIAPNPAKDRLKISNRLENVKMNDITILDINGRTMQQTKVTGNLTEVSLHLSPGIYIVNMRFDSGIVSKKLVIE